MKVELLVSEGQQLSGLSANKPMLLEAFEGWFLLDLEIGRSKFWNKLIIAYISQDIGI